MAKRVGCDKASILRTAQEFLQHQTPLQVTLLAPADSVGSAVTFTVTAYTSQRLDHAIRAARSLSGLSTASDATYTVRAFSPDQEGNSGHVAATGDAYEQLKPYQNAQGEVHIRCFALGVGGGKAQDKRKDNADAAGAHPEEVVWRHKIRKAHQALACLQNSRAPRNHPNPQWVSVNRIGNSHVARNIQYRMISTDNETCQHAIHTSVSRLSSLIMPRQLTTTPPTVIAIEGAIGVGKSSVLKALKDRGHQVLMEGVDSAAWEHNGRNVLRDAYNGLAGAHNLLQLIITLETDNTQRVARMTAGDVVFTERSILGQLAFIRANYESGVLAEEMVRVLGRFSIATAALPGGVIELRASTAVALQRIRRRGRDGEQRVSAAYNATIASYTTAEVQHYVALTRQHRAGTVSTTDSTPTEAAIAIEQWLELGNTEGSEHNDALDVSCTVEEVQIPPRGTATWPLQRLFFADAQLVGRI